MSVGTVSIQVSPQAAKVLRQLEARAELQQMPFDVYLQTLAEDKVSAAPPVELSSSALPPMANLTPQEKARLWMEWTTKLAVRVPHPVDDSRESIYTREDECL